MNLTEKTYNDICVNLETALSEAHLNIIEMIEMTHIALRLKQELQGNQAMVDIVNQMSKMSEIAGLLSSLRIYFAKQTLHNNTEE